VTSEQRGQFLTFRSSDAREVCATLKARRVTTDARGDRLRVGFGCYHDAATVDALLERLDASVGV
jgi:selenocysteine lyase/cysteine desulfurase